MLKLWKREKQNNDR
jgi:hypothetical protein